MSKRKKVPKFLLIFAALFIVWAITDFHNYFTIGVNMLKHYAGIESVAELVNYTLIQGFVKTGIALLLIIIFILLKKRNNHQ